jgi:AcrR family transcriptional regulator
MFGKSLEKGVRWQRREAKRERILAAARRLVLQGGVDELSLREVARAARLSPAGMYEFFESKAQLIEELGSEVSRALASAIAAAGRRADEPQGRLVAMGLAYVHFAVRHPQDFQLLFGRIVARRRSLAQDVPGESPYGQIRAAVARVIDLARLQRRDPRALEAFSYGFWSTVHGMAMLRLTHLAGFRADFETASRVVLESIVRGWLERGHRG